KAAVNANINVTAAYSYTDAEYTHDTVSTGKRPAEVPRNMASLKAAVNANINVTAAYSYTDAEYTHDTVSTGKRPA
ncbi:ferrichrome porin FhuA, partial [Klebsiella pneumoniae]